MRPPVLIRPALRSSRFMCSVGRSHTQSGGRPGFGPQKLRTCSTKLRADFRVDIKFWPSSSFGFTGWVGLEVDRPSPPFEVAPQELYRRVEKDWLYHRFDLRRHLLSGDAVGSLVPAAGGAILAGIRSWSQSGTPYEGSLSIQFNVVISSTALAPSLDQYSIHSVK